MKMNIFFFPLTDRPATLIAISTVVSEKISHEFGFYLWYFAKM